MLALYIKLISGPCDLCNILLRLVDWKTLEVIGTDSKLGLKESSSHLPITLLKGTIPPKLTFPAKTNSSHQKPTFSAKTNFSHQKSLFPPTSHFSCQKPTFPAQPDFQQLKI